MSEPLNRSRFNDLEWAFENNKTQYQRWVALRAMWRGNWRPELEERLLIEFDREDMLSYIED